MNNIIHFMARLSLLYYLLWSTSIHAYAHNRDTDPNSTYPTPDRLFHIARSLNRNLVCYDANQANGKLVCRVKIDNRQAILQSLYVKASPNNPLNVEYVELQGITTDTGVPVTEKISK